MPGLTGAPAERADLPKGDPSTLDQLGHLLNALWGSGPPGRPSSLDEAVGDGPQKNDPKAKKKTTKKKEADPKATPQPDPWTQLAQQLVGQLQQEQAPIEAAISGSLAAPAAQGAEDIALEATGLSPSSPTGQWISQQVQKGAQESDPLQAALASYGSAYGAGQVGVDQALVNMGKANDQEVNTAGVQPFLSAIASHIGGGEYYTIPAAQAAGLPTDVQKALTNAGWTVDSPATSKAAASLTGSPATVPTGASSLNTPTVGTGVTQ